MGFDFWKFRFVNTPVCECRSMLMCVQLPVGVSVDCPSVQTDLYLSLLLSPEPVCPRMKSPCSLLHRSAVGEITRKTRNELQEEICWEVTWRSHVTASCLCSVLISLWNPPFPLHEIKLIHWWTCEQEVCFLTCCSADGAVCPGWRLQEADHTQLCRTQRLNFHQSLKKAVFVPGQSCTVTVNWHEWSGKGGFSDQLLQNHNIWSACVFPLRNTPEKTPEWW